MKMMFFRSVFVCRWCFGSHYNSARSVSSKGCQKCKILQTNNCYLNITVQLILLTCKLLCPIVLYAMRKTHKKLGEFMTYKMIQNSRTLSNCGLSHQFAVVSRFLWRHSLTYEFLYVSFHMWPHTIQTFSPTNQVVCKFAYSAGCGLEPILTHGPHTPPQHCLCSPTSSGGADFYQKRSFRVVRSVSCPPYLIHCATRRSSCYCNTVSDKQWWPPRAAVTAVLYLINSGDLQEQLLLQYSIWYTVVTCRNSRHCSTVSDKQWWAAGAAVTAVLYPPLPFSPFVNQWPSWFGQQKHVLALSSRHQTYRICIIEFIDWGYDTWFIKQAQGAVRCHWR